MARDASESLGKEMLRWTKSLAEIVRRVKDGADEDGCELSKQECLDLLRGMRALASKKQS